MRRGSAARLEGGFTYVAMLVAVAVIGAGLAAAGIVWSQSRQREKEQELMFVGDQIRLAIARYYERTPGPVKLYPQKMEDLLLDNRFPGVQRHLRKPYGDPLTGKAEWGLISAPGGGFMGVYSLSKAQPIKTAGFAHKDRTFRGATTYQEWQFFYEPPALPVPAVVPAEQKKPASNAGASASMPTAATAAGNQTQQTRR